jgi:HTH-type transcriptional regulator, transcriptional repressor of NAD biosynthesis genes
MVTGLIIGKFNPPHRGHSFLIETALKETDSLTVLICSSTEDEIPVETRVQWLLKSHPSIQIHVLDQDAFDRTNADAWISATRALVSSTPTYIFSSESYGIQYADLMGCTHRMVDRLRTQVPCSATQIRENPLTHLQFLAPHVADYFLSRSRDTFTA